MKALVIVALILSGADVLRAEVLSPEEFARLHTELQPTGSEVWRTIPWKTSLLDAQSAAVREGKPIFIWAMDGHPLGCTWNNGVLDRASTFSDPAIVRLLQEDFIPVAIDQAYQRRQDDGEGRFYQKIANQGPRKVGSGDGTTQGHYLVTPDGTLLSYDNTRDTQTVFRLLKEAIAKFEPTSDVALIEPGDPDLKYVYGPPAGGLVLRVHSLVLGGYEETDDEYRKMFQEGRGRDNFWILEEEHAALRRGDLPPGMVIRMARFHLVDNTRGEPPMWNQEDLVENTVSLRNGVLSGHLRLRNAEGDREFSADLLGYIEVNGDQVTRFDLVVKGLFRGEGSYTRGAPEGDFPLGIAFRLADGTDAADAIPPQGSRGWVEGYFQ